MTALSSPSTAVKEGDALPDSNIHLRAKEKSRVLDEKIPKGLGSTALWSTFYQISSTPATCGIFLLAAIHFTETSLRPVGIQVPGSTL